MARFDTGDSKALRSAIEKYLGELPGDLVCALQLWYEGLGGYGAPNPEDMAAMEAVLGSVPGWKDVGGVRYEKFGTQQSYKRVK